MPPRVQTASPGRRNVSSTLKLCSQGMVEATTLPAAARPLQGTWTDPSRLESPRLDSPRMGGRGMGLRRVPCSFAPGPCYLPPPTVS